MDSDQSSGARVRARAGVAPSHQRSQNETSELGLAATTGLLERADALAALEHVGRQAAAGAGSVVLVSGEAGVGKSALVARAFAPNDSVARRVLWGACDPLSTPRPLGPLYDVAHQAGGKLLATASSVDARDSLFDALLDELRRPPVPIVLVIEDAHWADGASLDLLRFLARRIPRTPALLVVTYRDDEVGPTHPLRTAIGDLPAANVTRIRLAPLSPNAVATLARAAGRPADGLHSLTGGNPFFVTEALAADPDAVPVTVRDAVVARAARLSDEARDVMELAAVVPSKIERWLISELLSPTAAAIEECRAIGMVQSDDGALAFRHELARRAIEDALPPDRRRALHSLCLTTLLGCRRSGIPTARLVHHADNANDIGALLQYGPIAAAQAAKVGAHREAAALYARVLRFDDVLPPRDRALLFEQYSNECYFTVQLDVALAARNEALALWRLLGDALREGDALRWMSRISWYRGMRDDAERYAAEAIATLERLPVGHELAMAYSNQAQLAMLGDDVDGAAWWADRAIAIAEPLGDRDCLTHALTNIGTAELNAEREGAEARLQKSLAMALTDSYHDHAARVLGNLGASYVKLRRYEQAERWLAEGIAYCEEWDLASCRFYQVAYRALLRFETGDWTQAAEDASSVLAYVRSASVSRILALVVLARIRMHRRDPGWDALLDEARDLALPTRELQQIAPVACARAEAAWLMGDLERTGDEAALGWNLTSETAVRWDVADLALWMHRANRLRPVELTLPAAVAHQLAGDWRSAADAWSRIGCVYQQALALAEADEESALLDALAMFERLGSEPTAALVRRRLRTLGVLRVPRGERSSTRKNPARLTDRQLQILTLVSEGRRDAEIAERLFLSTKTVGHHVSAILGKLGVKSRGEASAAARVQRIIAG